MSNQGDEYVLSVDEHAGNLFAGLNECLNDNDLIDVRLVADGNSFGAHRLILSSISPYFRKMFKQMPTSQQAFVVLDNVSSQSVQNLITFIYHGQVTVEEENLQEFLKVAKIFQIKGLNDDEILSANDPQLRSAGAVKACTKIGNGAKAKKPLNIIQSQWNTYHQEVTEYDSYGNVIYTNADEAEEFESETKNDYSDNGNYMDDTDYSMNGSTSEYSEYWNNDAGNYFDNGMEMQQSNGSEVKRSRRNNNHSDFDIVADIRTNDGRTNLFYNGHKYNKNGKGTTKQYWQCTKNSGAKCRATAITTDIDGVTMMKVGNADHTHA